MWALRLTLVGTPLAASYTTPGQYVKVRADGHEGVFAIASAPRPDRHDVELLVKRGGAVANALCAATIGDRFELSGALGRGFPLALARGRSLVLCAAGSG